MSTMLAELTAYGYDLATLEELVEDDLALLVQEEFVNNKGWAELVVNVWSDAAREAARSHLRSHGYKRISKSTHQEKWQHPQGHYAYIARFAGAEGWNHVQNPGQGKKTVQTPGRTPEALGKHLAKVHGPVKNILQTNKGWTDAARAAARTKHAVGHQVSVPNKQRIKGAAKESKGMSTEKRKTVAGIVKQLRATKGSKAARNLYGRRFLANPHDALDPMMG